jgi:hypothetical protein
VEPRIIRTLIALLVLILTITASLYAIRLIVWTKVVPIVEILPAVVLSMILYPILRSK